MKVNLSEFINFNRCCPVCKGPLTLYMQWIDTALFKGTEIKEKGYQFDKVDNCSSLKTDEETSFFMYQDGNSFQIEFLSDDMNSKLKNGTSFFFYVCNNEAIRDQVTDYDINVYKVCYYRSSSFLDYMKKDDAWILEDKSPGRVNETETLIYKTQDTILEKTYVLCLDHGQNKTHFWHFCLSPEEKKNPNFEPNTIDREMPLMNTRPKFEIEPKEKIIERFESWVLMS
jgi:hypothetical protein